MSECCKLVARFRFIILQVDDASFTQNEFITFSYLQHRLRCSQSDRLVFGHFFFHIPIEQEPIMKDVTKHHCLNTNQS